VGIDLILWVFLDAARLNQLGVRHHLAGDLSSAEACFRTALASAVGLPGAVMESNLAAVYKRQGRYEEAAGAYTRALAGRRGHPDAALTLNNLAEIRRLQGRYGEARFLLEQALSTSARREVRAAALNNLAELDRRAGRYTSAARRLREALALKEQVYGADHPEAAITANNLGKVYEESGDLPEAGRLYHRAIAIWERHSSEALPIGWSNLGHLYELQGRLPESEDLLVRAHGSMGTASTAVGAAIVQNLGSLRLRQRRYADAAALLRRSLDIHENPVALALYAQALQSTGKRREARDARDRAQALLRSHTIDVMAFR
jgi:tetratricopeptide (TPR) repeat protein